MVDKCVLDFLAHHKAGRLAELYREAEAAVPGLPAPACAPPLGYRDYVTLRWRGADGKCSVGAHQGESGGCVGYNFPGLAGGEVCGHTHTLNGAGPALVSMLRRLFPAPADESVGGDS